jgi:hypothetical protein
MIEETGRIRSARTILRKKIARDITDWAETLDTDDEYKPVFDQYEAGRRKGAFDAAQIALGRQP